MAKRNSNIYANSVALFLLLLTPRTHSGAHTHTCTHARAGTTCSTIFVPNSGRFTLRNTLHTVPYRSQQGQKAHLHPSECEVWKHRCSNSIAQRSTTRSHLVETPARVMTTSPSSPSPSPLPAQWRADCITIRQPDPNKQQLPQLTDKESGAIAHGRGHPIKQPGVTVGGVIILALLEPPTPPSFPLFLSLPAPSFTHKRLLLFARRGGCELRAAGLGSS